MLWQIRRDMLSLFSRGNSKESYLDPIDGFRSIANICITLLHLVAIFNIFVLPYPHAEWQQFLHSKAFALLNLMSFSLEIFFMLSGFLLTFKLINQWNKKSPHIESFIGKEYPKSLLKRVCRFWPGLLLATLVLLIFGEPFYPNGTYLFELFRNVNVWMFFQNYVDIDYWYITFTPLWSLSVDMQVHIILPLFLYLFYSMRKFVSPYTCLSILLLLSIIRGIIVFNPVTMPISSVGHRYPALAVLSPPHLIRWLQTNYNLTFLSDFADVTSMKLFMHKMYLPFEARFGSFIIGSMLAIKVIQTSNSHVKKNKSKINFKYIFFVLICLNMLTLIQGPDVPPSPPDFMLRLLIGSSRQLFTIGQAFILFTALCSPSHRYHCRWIKKFLSCRIWIPISKLSYLVYIIHLRLSFELIFGGPLRFLETYPITYSILISLPIVLFISQLISCIWYILVEKPIERAIKYCFEKTDSSKIYFE